MKENLEMKEKAVKEDRFWVALTRLCNNGCLFCLDSDGHDGTMVDKQTVDRQIRDGRKDGPQRLILSGGEPTIHPDFLSFVKLGRELGYTWIQTITNGRYFSYKKFAVGALRAGLSEATFSMHGHTAELHDRLVGVPKAFEQALRGMKNLLGSAVVNVDVVLNRLNIPHLKEILEFFITLGVHEFDLLHMVPFGRAWNTHRDLLFYDLKEMAPHLERAFELRKKHDIIVWTNRLPAPFLEGAEDLIQDAHKIFDEVRGRAFMFRAWADEGIEPPCRGDRCAHCNMRWFCAALETALKELSRDPFERIRISSGQVDLFQRFVESGRVTEGTGVKLVAASASSLISWLTQCSDSVACLDIEAARWEHAVDAADSSGVRSVELHSAEGAPPDQLSSFLAGESHVLRLPAEKEIRAVLADLSPPNMERVELYPRGREYPSDSARLDLPPDEVANLAEEFDVALTGFPPCIGGGEPSEAPLEAQVILLDSDGQLDLRAFTDWFIKERSLVKSLRCTDCVFDPECDGLHINALRHFGFRVLTPIERGSQ